MSDNLGDAQLRLSVKDELGPGLAHAEEGSKGFVSRAGGAFKKMGSALSVGFTLPMALAAHFAIDRLGEMQKADAQTASTIVNVGKASGVTAGLIHQQADKLRDMSGFSAIAIQQGENLVLTLGNISNASGHGRQTMELANRTMVDMAARMGIDVPAAATLLGKAIADPENAMSKLAKRFGLTKDQMKAMKKEMEATNDPTRRQAILMDALEKKIGGAGKAAGETAAAKFAILKDKLIDTGAKIMDTLMPAILSVVGVIQDLVSKFEGLSPQWRKIIAYAMLAAVALGPIITIGGTVIEVVGAIGSALALLASPIGLAVAALGLLTYAWLSQKGHMQEFLNALSTVKAQALVIFQYLRDVVWPMLVSAAQKTVAWLQAHVVPLVSGIMSDLGKTIKVWLDAIHNFWQAHGAQVMAAVQAIWKKIEPIVTSGMQIIAGVIRTVLALLRGDWGAAWQHMQETAKAVWDNIKARISLVVFAIKEVVIGAVDLLKAGLGAAWSLIAGAVKAKWAEISDMISRAWSEIKSVTTGAARLVVSTVNGAWDDVKSGVRTAWSTIEGLVGGGVRSIIRAVGSIAGGVLHAASGAFESIWTSFRGVINKLVDGWNSLHFKMPSIDTHIPGIGKVGGFDIGVPHIPHLAMGGIVTRPTLALIGESGPEAVVPLGGRRAGATMENHQHFYGERPDQWAASRAALFMFRSAGLAGVGIA